MFQSQTVQIQIPPLPFNGTKASCMLLFFFFFSKMEVLDLYLFFFFFFKIYLYDCLRYLLRHAGFFVAAHWLSCFMACGILVP